MLLNDVLEAFGGRAALAKAVPGVSAKETRNGVVLGFLAIERNKKDSSILAPNKCVIQQNDDDELCSVQFMLGAREVSRFTDTSLDSLPELFEQETGYTF